MDGFFYLYIRMISESKILSACGITSIISTVIDVDSFFFELRRNIQINPKSNIITDTTKQNRIENTVSTVVNTKIFAMLPAVVNYLDLLYCFCGLLQIR